MEKIQIVLARLDEDFRVKELRRVDLGERNVMERIDKPVSCMWLNRGTAQDVEKAQVYAKTEGYRVFTYPINVRDALSQAKKDIQRARH